MGVKLLFAVTLMFALSACASNQPAKHSGDQLSRASRVLRASDRAVTSAYRAYRISQRKNVDLGDAARAVRGAANSAHSIGRAVESSKDIVDHQRNGE